MIVVLVVFRRTELSTFSKVLRSGQPVVTCVFLPFAFAPREVTFIFIAHRVQHSHFFSFYARRFASNLLSGRAFRSV